MIARRYHAQQKAARAVQAAARKAENDAWERAAREGQESAPTATIQSDNKQQQDKQRQQQRR